MGFIITTQRHKKNICKETFLVTSNDVLQNPQKTSTTKSYPSKGYQNRFMQINCRLNLSLLSVQGEKKVFKGH